MKNRLGVIFDLDGVLVDSSEFHYGSWLAWGREVDEIDPTDLSREWFEATFGSRNGSIIPPLFDGPLTAAEIARHAHRKEELFRELALGRLEPLPGSRELVACLTEAGVPMAIGSSTPPENLAIVLEQIGLSSFFPQEHRVCGADVTKGKPDPEVFLTAAQRLDLPPALCVVIEDAGVGIKAAKAAGMACIGVTTTSSSSRSETERCPDATRSAKKLEEAGADVVVGSLEEVGLKQLTRLVEGYGEQP